MSGGNETSWHVERIAIERFGRLESVGVGTFAPGFNVVYCKAPGSKETLVSLMGGVLFGWHDAIAHRAAEVASGDLAACLMFRERDGRRCAMRRVGEQAPADDQGLLQDIDEDVFTGAFVLRSGDFAELGRATGFRRLLAKAACGGQVSPLAVMEELDARVGALTAPEGAPLPRGVQGMSIPQIMARLQSVEDELRALREKELARMAAWRDAQDEDGRPVPSSVESKRFTQLKQERAYLRTRLKDAREEYACVLVARRTLAGAAGTWQQGVPGGVQRISGILLEDLTDGVWPEVLVDDWGEVQVVDSKGNVRDPQLFSLQRRQQLYLALRTAFLMAADRTGRNLPVLADDVLSGLEGDDRWATAQMLMQLARTRQVLLFTGDGRTMAGLRQMNPQVNVVRL